MQAKPIILAAALVTFYTGTAFAQSAADQSATMQAPAPAPSPDAASPTSQPDSSPAPASTPATATVPATPADVKAGASVYDATGATVGTIESVTSAGAVVFTGTARAQIALASFSKNAQGLVIGMTKLQLQAAVAKASAPKR